MGIDWGRVSEVVELVVRLVGMTDDDNGSDRDGCAGTPSSLRAV